MKLKKIINTQRQRRKFRVRKTVRGTAERPRLSVSRSLKHFGCQVIDDESGRTLFSASSKDSGFDGAGGNCDAAVKVGHVIAEKAKAAGVLKACLDRGSSKYHGRVAAFANAVRAGGVEF